MVEQKRLRHKNAALIKYNATVFVNDLRCYDKQPLTKMAKKANPELYNKNWGGNYCQHPVSDGRDFTTTYLSSFDSQVLRHPAAGSPQNQPH